MKSNKHTYSEVSFNHMEHYAILAVYWLDSYIDVELTGNLPDASQFIAERVECPDDLIRIIDKLNDVCPLRIVINRSGFKSGWKRFLDKVYLINRKIKIESIDVQRGSGSAGVLKNWLLPLQMSVMNLESSAVIPL